MKKFTFVLMLAAVAMFVASPLLAEGMMFGVKGGLNMANLTGDDVPSDAKMKMGIVGGGFMCYNVTEIFAIQPELLFTMKGAKAEVGDASMKLNYIEIPLLLKVTLPTEGKIKPSLYAGPAIGILMSATAEEGGASEDIKEFLKSTDIGILAGAGIGYQMESGMLFLDARYEVGMASIDKAEGSEEEGDIKNTCISIMVGYGFAF